jgi:hypothetical protein
MDWNIAFAGKSQFCIPGGRWCYSRRSVEPGSNGGLQPSRSGNARVAKVGKHDPVRNLGGYAAQDVLWLDVPMGHPFAVDVGDTPKDLPNDGPNSPLIQPVES